MHSRLSFFLTALLISSLTATAQTPTDSRAQSFTIQVASFPDGALADKFAVQLARAGESPFCATVQIEGRGYWTRVFVGFFDTIDGARRHGDALIARGVISNFIVKKETLSQALSRPRRVTGSDVALRSYPASLAGTKVATATPKPESALKTPAEKGPSISAGSASTGKSRHDHLLNQLLDHLTNALPMIDLTELRLAPGVDTNLIPRPDPVKLAVRLVTGSKESEQTGGLWISGDTAGALARLRWMVGEESAELIKLDNDGRVRLDKERLAKAARLEENRIDDPLRALSYISSNEGLLLLVQVSQGRHRYRLHIGRSAPTLGKSVDLAGSLNLDNNVDSRINRYRKDGRKLDCERPPDGFDSLIGLNPVARWFNLDTNSWVQSGEIVFHELAEAYAKLEFGLDYLDQGLQIGAHAHALEREWRLKSQRPGEDIVLTIGSNRLLRTEEEIRLFYAEAGGGVSQR